MDGRITLRTRKKTKYNKERGKRNYVQTNFHNLTDQQHDNQLPSCYRSHKVSYSNFSPKIGGLRRVRLKGGLVPIYDALNIVLAYFVLVTFRHSILLAFRIFGHLWETVYKTVRPMLSNRCLCVRLIVCLSCKVGVLWPNGWMDQDATWYGG